MKRSFTIGSTIAMALVFTFLTGCSMTSTAKNFNSLPGADGQPVEYVSTTNVALHLLFSTPVVGNATLEQTVADFTKMAKDDGASKVRITQSDKTTLWWIFPPFSFIVQPVITNVAGDATL